MIMSMTGYGKGEGAGYTLEMRSVNHKFLDLSLKIPKDLLPLEPRLKKAVGERFSRGRIEVYVNRAAEAASGRALTLDVGAAKQYLGLLRELKERFDLPGEVDLAMLSSYRDIVSESEEAQDAEKIWSDIQGPLAECMDGLSRMRAVEGEALAADIRDRASAIAARIGEVEARAPEVVSDYAAKLAERVAKLAEGVELDADRLRQEVAVMADRCDITEEIVRARSHLSQLGDMLAGDGPVGRKMDFLLQEINRELNTIGSKASDRVIAHVVVEMKSELEKVREQAQNIE